MKTRKCLALDDEVQKNQGTLIIKNKLENKNQHSKFN